MSRPVHFELHAVSVQLDVAAEAVNVRFTSGDIAVSLAAVTNDAGFRTGDIDVVASATRDVPTEVEAQMQERLEGLDKESSLPPDEVAVVELPFLVMTAEEARWIIDPPKDVLGLCIDIGDELEARAAALIRLLRWTFNRPWPAQPLSQRYLRWSLDGERWESAPGADGAVPAFGDMEGRDLTDEQIAVLERIWDSGETHEPLARQILLEAQSMVESNPRAAYVLGVAAAEIGVKQFGSFASRAESESWLLQEMQSPPLDRLLREYLPFSTDKRTKDGLVVPTSLTRVFEKGIRKRNRLVHRGEAPPSVDEVGEVLAAVNDLLYLLDWFSGHTWAFNHLRDVTTTAFDRESEAS